MVDASWVCSNCGRENTKQANDLDTATVMEAVSDINSSEVLTTVMCKYCNYETEVLVELSVE